MRSIAASMMPSWSADLFEAVQAKLAAGAVVRRLRLKASSAILTGRIFDDRGNRMTPTHSVKHGARYRYYVSRALVQQRREDAGSVLRVPAPEIESLVLAAVRRHLETNAHEGQPVDRNDRDLVEHHIVRVVVKPGAIEVELVPTEDQPVTGDDHHGDPAPITLTLPWAPKNFTAQKGIIHAPAESLTLNPERRDAILTAIAKARRWIDDLVAGRTASFAEIATCERKVKRLIRMRTTLAFLSPRIVIAIINGSAPTDLTVTALARSLSDSWAEQERQIR